MKLRYKAVTKEGNSIQGLIEAADRSEAANYLRSKDLLPIRITHEKGRTAARIIPFLGRLRSKDIVLFTRQLSSMLASGLTLMRSLEILKEQLKDRSVVGDILDGIIADIEEGKTFSAAISKHPEVFSPIYIASVKAGESGGLLDKALLRLSENLEKQAALRSMIKGALVYPIIVVSLMIVVVVIMLVYVVPQLGSLYENMSIALPLPTLIILGLSKIVITLWPIFIVVAVVGYTIFNRWKKTEDGRLIWDTLILKAPIFGKLFSQKILTEFTRTLGLLVGTGTLIVESLRKTADTTGNICYENAITDISKQVEKGVSVGDAMSYYPLFPPMLVQLVKIGEQTGKIDENLTKASEYFEREVNETVKTLTASMEPAIMIILGVGVAFLIISIITPIYSLITAIK